MMIVKKSAVFFALLLLVSFSLALSDEGIATQSAMQQAQTDMNVMSSAGLSVLRVNDTLREAQSFFDAQMIIEQNGGKGTYTFVTDRTSQIAEIRKTAFELNDELLALKLRLDEVSPGIDKKPAQDLYDQARAEFMDERYDNVKSLITQTYQKISQLEAESTTAAALYGAASASVQKFVENNYQGIIVTIIIIIVVLKLSYGRIYIYRKRRKIKRLELEKEILEKLIRKTQSEYFDRKSMSEGAYHIKLKKFSELIRDINRQIPLLKEEIEKKRGTKSKFVLVKKKEAKTERKSEVKVKPENKSNKRKKK